jgi:hypothetical protein
MWVGGLRAAAPRALVWGAYLWLPEHTRRVPKSMMSRTPRIQTSPTLVKVLGNFSQTQNKTPPTTLTTAVLTQWETCGKSDASMLEWMENSLAAHFDRFVEPNITAVNDALADAPTDARARKKEERDGKSQATLGVAADAGTPVACAADSDPVADDLEERARPRRRVSTARQPTAPGRRHTAHTSFPRRQPCYTPRWGSSQSPTHTLL